MPEGIKTVVKGLSGAGVTEDANMAQIDIKDGKIIRIRPFHYDWKYPREHIKPWKIEARGQTFEASLKALIPPFSLAYKNRVYSPNRTLFPLKRVDWDPNGERNTQNRGISKYERISWDEATTIIASEIKRVIKQYGPTAILAQADGHGETKVVHASHGCCRRLLSLLGGYTWQTRNPDSWEGLYWGAKHVYGSEPVGKQDQSNLVPDIAKNTDMLLFEGCDPETTPWGWGGQTVSQLCYWFTELGIKQIYVCPDLNYGAAVHADKWIPIRPNTDAAFYLAIAYLWITQGTYDKEYIKTHVVGFDQFCDYVLGKEDGIAKTPVWASEKTGIPIRLIKAVAKAWAEKRTTTVHANGGNMSRSPFAHENLRMEICLLGMQGLGKPGRHFFTTIEWGLFGLLNPPQWGYGNSIPVPRHSKYPDLVPANRGFAVVGKDLPAQIISKAKIVEALNDPPIEWYGTTLCRELTENQFVKYKYPADGCSEIHMIWTDTPALMTCWNDSNYTARGYQNPKVEFMLAQHPWIENDCQFADIILPVTTKFENNDIGIDNFTAEFGTLFLDAKCVDARGESKSDYEAVCAIAEKLGMLEEYTQGRSVEDWIKFGFDNCGVKDDISWEEFQEKGHYVIPNDPDWEKHDNKMMQFARDPQKYPLTTPTGKLEFYSERLAKHFPGDNERPPVPHWVEKSEAHDERISSPRAKDYPFLVTSNHPRWRVHSQHDDMQWLREMETNKITGPDGYAYQTMWLNPSEAEKKGIRNHDIVMIYNERGGVLAGAYVTERIMPGVVYIDHGARWDPVVVGELDRGGAINTITPRKTCSKNATGMVSGGFLVDVVRVDLDELAREFPEAFKRPYHPASGLRYERMLAKKK